MPPGAEKTGEAVLLGDIGGTNVRFALFADGTLGTIAHAAVADYPGMAAAIRDFLASQTRARRVTAAVLGLAGPVENNHCTVTNSHWIVDGDALRDEFGFASVRLVNDFEALAWSLGTLTAEDLFPIGGGRGRRSAPMVVLGPGTGLGVAALIPQAGGPIVFATEGGHATLAAADAEEDAVIGFLRKRFGHVSAERALSGPGLHNLYEAIAALKDIAVPPRTAEEITQAAIDNICPVSRAALDMFCAMLGTVAGSLAVTFRAQGGVHIAGGIVPRIRHYVARSGFRARFESMGRFRQYVEAIPTSVILNPDMAFAGLKQLALRIAPRPADLQ